MLYFFLSYRRIQKVIRTWQQVLSPYWSKWWEENCQWILIIVASLLHGCKFSFLEYSLYLGKMTRGNFNLMNWILTLITALKSCSILKSVFHLIVQVRSCLKSLTSLYKGQRWIITSPMVWFCFFVFVVGFSLVNDSGHLSILINCLLNSLSFQQYCMSVWNVFTQFIPNLTFWKKLQNVLATLSCHQRWIWNILVRAKVSLWFEYFKCSLS